MKLFKGVTGGMFATIGFILSPLSWWNDLLVNLPIAYGIGIVAGMLKEGWFLPGMVVGYWFSNVTGLMLMHFGVRFGWGRGKKLFTRRDLVRDLVFSIGYTILIIVFVQMGILASPDKQISQFIDKYG